MIRYVSLFLEGLCDAVGELFVKSGAGTTIASKLATTLPQGEAHSPTRRKGRECQDTIRTRRFGFVALRILIDLNLTS